MIADYTKTTDAWVLNCDNVKFKIPFEYTTSNEVHLMTVSKECMDLLKNKYNNPCLCWKYNGETVTNDTVITDYNKLQLTYKKRSKS